MIPIRDINPTETRPVLTYALLGANFAVFLYQASLEPIAGELFIRRWGMVPVLLAHADAPSTWATPLTSMFMHGSWIHLISNLWFLHIFGDNVEDRLGKARFVVFYLACGLAAAATQVLANPASAIPMVGASGAVSGVLGAYMRLFPRTRVIALVPVFFVFVRRELPAGFFIVFWFVIQLLYALGSVGKVDAQTGGVAFFAHVGGFVAGVALLRLFDPGTRPRRGRAHLGRGPAPRVD